VRSEIVDKAVEDAPEVITAVMTGTFLFVCIFVPVFYVIVIVCVVSVVCRRQGRLKCAGGYHSRHTGYAPVFCFDVSVLDVFLPVICAAF
jgi:hypothetical protein